MHAQHIKPHIGSKAWFVPETGELEIRDGSDGTISSVTRGRIELTLSGLSLELDTRKGGDGVIRVPLRQIGAIKDRRKPREQSGHRKTGRSIHAAPMVTRTSLRAFIGCYAWWLRDTGVLQIRERSEARITSVTSREVILALEGFARKSNLKRGGEGTMTIPIRAIQGVEDQRSMNFALSAVSAKTSPGNRISAVNRDPLTPIDLHRLAQMQQEKLKRKREQRRNRVFLVLLFVLAAWALWKKLEASGVLLSWLR